MESSYLPLLSMPHPSMAIHALAVLIVYYREMVYKIFMAIDAVLLQNPAVAFADADHIRRAKCENERMPIAVFRLYQIFSNKSMRDMALVAGHRAVA